MQSLNATTHFWIVCTPFNGKLRSTNLNDNLIAFCSQVLLHRYWIFKTRESRNRRLKGENPEWTHYSSVIGVQPVLLIVRFEKLWRLGPRRRIVQRGLSQISRENPWTGHEACSNSLSGFRRQPQSRKCFQAYFNCRNCAWTSKNQGGIHLQVPTNSCDAWRWNVKICKFGCCMKII